MVRDIRSRPYYFDFLFWVLRTAWMAGVWVEVHQMVLPDIKIVIYLVADPYFLYILIIFVIPASECASP